MFDLRICARYVIIFWGSLVKAGAVIEFTKPPGKAIPESTFRIIKEKPKAYQVKQVLLAIERLEVGHGSEK